MPCRELVELVTDFLDGALDEPARTRLEPAMQAAWLRLAPVVFR